MDTTQRTQTTSSTAMDMTMDLDALPGNTSTSKGKGRASSEDNDDDEEEEEDPPPDENHEEEELNPTAMTTTTPATNDPRKKKKRRHKKSKKPDGDFDSGIGIESFDTVVKTAKNMDIDKEDGIRIPPASVKSKRSKKKKQKEKEKDVEDDANPPEPEPQPEPEVEGGEGGVERSVWEWVTLADPAHKSHPPAFSKDGRYVTSLSPISIVPRLTPSQVLLPSLL